MAVSFTISLVLHLLAVVFYPVVMDRVTPDPDDPDADPLFEEVPRLITLREVEELPEEEEEPEAVPDVPAVLVPDPAPPAVAEEAEVEPVEPDAPEVEEAPRRTAAERLRPRMVDPDLWRFMDPEALELTDEERFEIAVRVAIQALGDSLTAEEERQLQALDWTYTDDDGETWGISPGTLHLGDREIPLPFEFTPPPGLMDETARLQWELWEFGRAHTLGAVRDVWRERAEEIRRRREAERADSLDSRR